MNHMVRSRFIELFGRKAEFLFGLVDFVGFDEISNFAEMRLQFRFGGPIVGAANEALAVTFLCAWRIGHETLVFEKILAKNGWLRRIVALPPPEPVRRITLYYARD